jgi:ATP synthase protein I
MIEQGLKWRVSVGSEMNEKMQPEARVYETFKSKLASRQLIVELEKIGFYGIEPGESMVVVQLNQQQWVYPHVKPEQVDQIIEKHLVHGKPIETWITSRHYNIPVLAASNEKGAKTPALARFSEILKSGSHTKPDTAGGNERSNDYSALSLIGVGWYICISILIGIFGGIWLDNRLNTGHLFLIIGLVFGLISAVYGVAKIVRRQIDLSNRQLAQQEPENKLQDVLNDTALTSRHTDELIKSTSSRGRREIEQNVMETVLKHNLAKKEFDQGYKELIKKGKESISRDKIEAIKSLKREFEKFAASTNQDSGSTNKQDST